MSDNATGFGGIGNVTPTVGLVEMAMAYARSRVVCAAARLEIADALADGKSTVAEIAETCGANADALYRLLRTLASLGIVSEVEPGRFVLTAFGEPLRKNHAQSVWPAVIFWADLLADSWSYLTECVRSGETASQVMQGQGIASKWSKDPNAGAIFRAVMGTAPAEDYMPIAQRCNLEGRQTVADLGGGGGALISAILKANPEVSGVLVDRPAAIEAATGRFDAEGLSTRCRLMSGDLIESVPSGAEVYAMKHVLHGYADDVAEKILKNCREVMPSGGLLLIIEFVLPDVVAGADRNLESRFMSDLNMLAVTGGRERSSAEWKRLLERAGFEMLRIVPVGDGKSTWIEEVSVIEAKPEAKRGGETA